MFLRIYFAAPPDPLSPRVPARPSPGLPSPRLGREGRSGSPHESRHVVLVAGVGVRLGLQGSVFKFIFRDLVRFEKIVFKRNGKFLKHENNTTFSLATR